LGSRLRRGSTSRRGLFSWAASSKRKKAPHVTGRPRSGGYGLRYAQKILFLAKPPFPERLISAVPAEYFIKSRMMIRGGTGTGFLTETVINEYIRCYTLKTITGSCRDYRATATCDFEMDTADKVRKSICRCFCFGAHEASRLSAEFLDVWKRYASNIVAHEAIDCGHYIQEEVPEKVIQHFTSLFKV
jgi:haloacetate dehalogenase